MGNRNGRSNATSIRKGKRRLRGLWVYIIAVLAALATWFLVLPWMGQTTHTTEIEVMEFVAKPASFAVCSQGAGDARLGDSQSIVLPGEESTGFVGAIRAAGQWLSDQAFKQVMETEFKFDFEIGVDFSEPDTSLVAYGRDGIVEQVELRVADFDALQVSRVRIVYEQVGSQLETPLKWDEGWFNRVSPSDVQAFQVAAQNLATDVATTTDRGLAAMAECQEGLEQLVADFYSQINPNGLRPEVITLEFPTTDAVNLPLRLRATPLEEFLYGNA